MQTPTADLTKAALHPVTAHSFGPYIMYIMMFPGEEHPRKESI
jgi:hypothetical protein